MAEVKNAKVSDCTNRRQKPRKRPAKEQKERKAKRSKRSPAPLAIVNKGGRERERERDEGMHRARGRWLCPFGAALNFLAAAPQNWVAAPSHPCAFGGG